MSVGLPCKNTTEKSMFLHDEKNPVALLVEVVEAVAVVVVVEWGRLSVHA